MRPIPRLLIVMMHKSSSRLIELPDRKELTLCEAVTAFIYGKAYDLRQLARDTPKEQIANAQDLLDRLHQAAYAGRVKFRALQEGDDPATGYKDIEPRYFYINPLFHWSQDVIVHEESELSTPWYFVHLDREDFVSLLRDMGVSVQQSPDLDILGSHKTVRTGAQGAPTSMHLVLQEAQRRLDAGKYPGSLTAFTEDLANWLEVTEPKAAPTKPKTMRNNPKLQELWRRHKSPKIIDRS